MKKIRKLIRAIGLAEGVSSLLLSPKTELPIFKIQPTRLQLYKWNVSR